MDKEIKLINSLDDKEYSEENVSDTSYEDDFSEIEETPAVGKKPEADAKTTDPKTGDGKSAAASKQADAAPADSKKSDIKPKDAKNDGDKTVDNKANDKAEKSSEQKPAPKVEPVKKTAPDAQYNDLCHIPVPKNERLASNQHALKHLRTLFPPNITEMVEKSETRLIELFEFISGDVLTMNIIPNRTDDVIGTKILKAAYLLNMIKDMTCINLRRESISRFLAKAFEFLLNFDFNFNVSAKLVHIMNQYKFRHFDMQYVEEMFRVSKSLQMLIQKVFERTIYQMSNTRVAQEIKNYVMQMMLKLISKINVVFRKDFKQLYKYTDDNNFTYLDENGVQFSYYFFAAKYFNRQDFNVIMNEIMFYRTCDIRMKSKATAAFLVRAVKNRYFVCTLEVLQRIMHDAHKLCEDIVKDSDENQDMYIRFMGYILAHVMFSRENTTQEFEECVLAVRGFFEGIIDVFHPMNPATFRIDYYKKVMSNFIKTYTKQFKKCIENRSLDTNFIKNNIHPLLKKMTSFCVVGVYWDGLDNALVDLCVLDSDYFLGEILEKIKLSFDFEEFRKIDILRSIRNMAVFMRSEKNVHHIEWMVPTLIKQMEMSASEHLALIIRALISIFQNFILIDATTADYLKPLKDMIVDAAIKVIEFHIKKADVFAIEQSFLGVLISLSPKCAKKFRDLVLAQAKDDFILMKPGAAETYISEIHLHFPSETEKVLLDWFQTKVLNKGPSKSADEFSLGNILKMNGIASIDYQLAVQNEKSLLIFLKIGTALSRNGWVIKQDTYILLLSFFALCSESSISSVSSLGVKAFASFFQDYDYAVAGCTSTIRFNEYLAQKALDASKAHFPQEFKWILPERENPERTKQLLTTIFYETLASCERLLVKIYDSGKKESKLGYPLELYVEKFYQEVQNKDTKEEAKSIEHPDLGKLGKYLTLLGNCMKTKYIQLVQLRSNRTRAYIDLLMRKLTQFMADTNTYASLRGAYLNLYHIRNTTACDLSNMNENSSKLYNYGKSILLTFDRANFNFQVEQATSILADYLPIDNYCHYDDWLLVDGCITQTDFKDYPMKDYPDNPDKFFWLFSKELCEYYYNNIITTFFRQNMLFLQNYESSSMFEPIKEMISGSWLCCSDEDFVRFYLWSILNVLLLDHKTQENFNKLVLYCDSSFDLCLTGYMLPNEEIVFNLLQIGRQFIIKGTYNTVFPVYYKLITRLINYGNLPPDQKIDHMFELLDIMQKKTDGETSLVDLLEASTRFLLFYRSWDAKFRAALVKYVITHINSKDLNKRIIYMGIVAFMNRTLRKTDYIFKEVSVNHTKFLNQNGYIDTYMLKEAFRQIRSNVGYSTGDTMIFTDDQMEELSHLNEDCIPAVVYPTYLSLPFKALTYEVSKENTVKVFKDTMLSADEKIKYQKCLVEFIMQLIDEYSEDFDDKSLYVDYTFSELLIDTKNIFKFSKDMSEFACLKIFCMFLGLDTIEEVFLQLQEEHKSSAERSGDYNKVILSFYSALVGAGGFYTEPEFRRVISMGKPIMKPFFNSINAKFLEDLSVQLNKSLRGNLSYKRLKMFFTMIRELMHEDSKDHAVYYLNILIFQITISQMILTDDLLQTFKDIMEDLKVDDLVTASIVSRVFRSIYGTRLLISFNEDYIKKARRIVTEDTVSTHIYDKEVIDFDDYLIEFLRSLQSAHPWVKLEGARYIVFSILDKKLTSHNVPTFKKICQIIFTFTGPELRDQSIAAVYKALINDMRVGIIVQRHVRDNIMNLLTKSWKFASCAECYKGILKIFKIGLSGKITDQVHKFMRMITKLNKLNLQDDVFVFIRDDVFTHVSDTDLFEYSHRLFKEIEPLVAKREKLKDTQGQEYKDIDAELESLCELLLGIVSSRRWQMNAELELCLKWAATCRKHSPEAKKTFNNFVNDFWSRRALYADLNDYKMSEETSNEYSHISYFNYLN